MFERGRPMANQTVSVLRTRDDQVIPVAGIYEIDAPHTSVEFVGRHLMITKVRVGFSAATDITREDFGLAWNVALETGGLLVGKTVRIELAVQAIAATKAAVS